jgi:hypothetical protein
VCLYRVAQIDTSPQAGTAIQVVVPIVDRA